MDNELDKSLFKRISFEEPRFLPWWVEAGWRCLIAICGCMIFTLAIAPILVAHVPTGPLKLVSPWTAECILGICFTVCFCSLVQWWTR